MTDTQYNHARFWKCALQVNPDGYSKRYRGQDHGLSPEAYTDALLEMCRQNDITVVGLADHGGVQDVDAVRNALSPHGIVVFPGFEISSTERIHMVCLFAEETTTEELHRILGKLELMDPEERVTPSRLGCLKIAEIIYEQEGFWFAAHMTGAGGLLRLHGDGGGLPHVWKDHRLVQAGQIPGPVEALPEKYQAIISNKNPDYLRARQISVINAKDVAKPQDLADASASTFIKMTRPCFAAFLVAFKDPESRVRLGHQMMERFYSRIESLRIEGGYLDGLAVSFSRHLNTVIGGRGTGKSTLLECLRYALDVPHKGHEAQRQADQIVAENLGRDGGRVIVELCSMVNNMERYRIVRRYGEPARVIDEKGNESSLHPGTDLLPRTEIYGQNEIYELARSPEELTRVLDRFLPEEAASQARLAAAYKQLSENGERLQKAHEQKDDIEGRIADLPKLEERAKQFRDHGLEEQLETVPLLEKERQLEPRMRQELDRVRDAKQRFQEELPDLVFLSDGALQGLPHADILRDCRQILADIQSGLQQKLSEIDSVVAEAATCLAPHIERLKQALVASETDIEKQFADLPAIAGRTGRQVGVAYQGLLREIERINPTRSRLKTVDDLVGDLDQTRRNLLGEISDIRSVRTAAKRRGVEDLNERLAGKLRIAVVPDGLRQPLHAFLQSLPGVGPQKTRWIDDAEGFTVTGLVAAIRDGKETLLNRNWGLTPGSAETLTRLSASQLHALETIDLEDRVKIELNVSHTGPERFRLMEQLSVGQQCTAILLLLLLNNPDPLIMDQPEDNLDNAFIAERIVRELRSAKTERQFLFATHNANIPVFGDAEWIGVCTAAGDRGGIAPDVQGSIDVPKVREQAANILDGGRVAFTTRREKYGY